MRKIHRFITSLSPVFERIAAEKFILCFDDINLYLSYLDLIILRYQTSNAELYELATSSIRSDRQIGSAQRIESPDDRCLARTQVAIHLDIESFYLFAKILLDKIARSLEFFFGPGRKVSLDSHDKAVKNLASFLEQKQLPPISFEMQSLMESLKTEISDYRDYEISHQKGAGIQRSTMFSLHDFYASVVKEKIHLPDSRLAEPKKSSAPPLLVAQIEGYVELILGYLEKNKGRSCLAVKKSAP